MVGTDVAVGKLKGVFIIAGVLMTTSFCILVTAGASDNRDVVGVRNTNSSLQAVANKTAIK
jgi:hypothetical protein